MKKLNEMDTKGKKKRIALTIISIILIIAFLVCVFISLCAYGHSRHRIQFNIDSITYTLQEENNYKVDINGTVKTWWFDPFKYKEIQLIGPVEGGEPHYKEISAQSTVFDASKKPSDFSITVFVDTSSYYWSDNDASIGDLELYIDQYMQLKANKGYTNYKRDFHYTDDYETGVYLFMADHNDFTVEYVNF